MSMKIVAGIGSIDDYEVYVAAGADECFGGYVPQEYMLRYGRRTPANRREVVYYNVHIGSESELLILRRMIEKYGKPVSIAFNGLFYGAEERTTIIDTVKQCIDMGYTDFIVAEPELIEKLAEVKGARITVSGELGELNEGVVKSICQNARRIIYPRQTTIEEMAYIKDISDTMAPKMEFEAFVLNEKCHYTGAYCNSLHCDELCHMCKLPYRIYDRTGCVEDSDVRDMDTPVECVGETGCALCLLWRYSKAGVTHLKIVSRGNSSEATCRDITTLRKALDILEECTTEEEYVRRLFAEVLTDGCSKNCYTRRYSKPIG